MYNLLKDKDLPKDRYDSVKFFVDDDELSKLFRDFLSDSNDFLTFYNDKNDHFYFCDIEQYEQAANLGNVTAMKILGRHNNLWYIKGFVNSCGHLIMPKSFLEKVKRLSDEDRFLWGRELKKIDLKYYPSSIYTSVYKLLNFYQKSRKKCKEAIHLWVCIAKKFYGHLLNKDVRRKISELILLNDIEWAKNPITKYFKKIKSNGGS